jgi:hypothetical protein
MILEDLQHIFKTQFEEGTDKLYFMLIDGESKLVERHPADQLADLLPCLDCYYYAGIVAGMPHFVK